jgi:ABC-type transport system involved in multi-copper enzyme maturation permease subunit
MQWLALVVDSFRESMDRKIFWILLLLSVVAAATMLCVGFVPGSIDLMFGMWQIETELFDPTRPTYRPMIAYVAVSLMDLVLGTVGILMMIIATAGFFPSFMERGSVDVLLSKPVGRTRLFLGKYLGSMGFVLVQATVFVVLSFLVMGFRWKVWLPRYLLTIPLMVLMFSYLYGVSVLAAVMTRNTIAAIFITLGAWCFVFGVQELNDMLELNPQWQEQRTVYYAARTLKWALPKTQDLRYLADRWTDAGYAADLIPASQRDPIMMGRLRELEEEARKVSAVASLGSSLAFEAVVVAAAIWLFSRHDF